ncbi:hypothetical protein DPMN_009500 [Dreissena polymorpha]|uniref:HAT C-terminal dimerisation domain-containing protein n=1 Tax=Dreissena polymorpha TaxID=45954 RepID=A0A9D4N0K6_DREPO|nr:hypothetical protein DPMN_009500 [Dreissena polymorpha]
MHGRDVDLALKLVELVLAPPPTSVKNETSFSAMKLIKHKRRGKMSTDTLNDLVAIHLDAPSIAQFNPDDAIMEWMVCSLYFYYLFILTINIYVGAYDFVQYIILQLFYLLI